MNLSRSFLVVYVFFVSLILSSPLIYRVSNADTIVLKAPSDYVKIENANTSKNPNKIFNATGFVSNITDSSFSIDNAKGTNDKSQTYYTFGTDMVTKIETKNYTPLSLSDIKIGDKVVVQGVDRSGEITIKRIISLDVTDSRDVSTSTAPSTEEKASSTESSASSTPSLLEVIKDVVSGFVDAITGSSTASSTKTEQTADTASTATSSDTGTTTTPNESSVPNPVGDDLALPPLTPNLLNDFIGVAKDVANKIMGSGDVGTQEKTPVPVEQVAPLTE